ncbi:MAG: putative chaperone protein HtpG [Vampirovibrio sp.]|jgi:molecular chaperone HtpG|nr:putative chaperone protein HtpG [Vampirovibrio sp.]
MTTTVERHSFQAETRELLDLMIHAIYSNKDIFLRELISNASDAIDKLQFESLTNPDLPKVENPHILLIPNKAAHSLTIEDNGIGMSREDVVKLIGTIAKSGTREFMTALKDSKNQEGIVPPELIGQFGVGFYSTFMVADKVTLETRKAGEEHGTRWESSGDGTYTIEAVDRPTHGTTITLHLKKEDSEDGLHDYTAEWTIKGIVKKYSDFVSYPIQMDVEHTEYDRDENGKMVEGSAKTSIKRETLNSMKAIWARPESEVTEEEYKEFYRHISHDWHDPMAWFRMKMEGTFEAQSLLFIPEKAPQDLFYREGRRGIQLYVKRVFIMDDCKELMPDYLRFIKGVVDSEDLSLNISREILQQNRQIRAIRKRLVKKVLSTLEDMATNDREKYLTFWGEFGRALKEGIYEDQENRESLLDLALFATTEYESELTTLKDYVSRMKSGQDKIYFMTGEDRKTIENSPHLEAFREKGYEVLLFTDAVDEVWTQSAYKYGEFEFQSVGKGTVELGTEEEKQQAEKELEQKEQEYHTLLETMQARLGDFVKEVRLSNRLTSSPSCLVGNPSDLSPQMEQMLRAMNQPVPQSKRILELNPNHPLTQKLQGVFSANQNDPTLNDYAYMLYGQALLAEGSPLPDPAKFSKLMTDLLVKAI